MSHESTHRPATLRRPKRTHGLGLRLAAVAGAAALAVGGVVVGDIALSTAPTASAAVANSLPKLRHGDSGKSVSALQTILNAHGYSLSVDGKFGPATLKAVKHLQGLKGLQADGVVGPNTWGSLVAKVRPGDSNNDVKAVQMLVGAGVDGKYGPETRQKVEAFQRSAGLAADGVVGPNTWAALVGKAPTNDGGDDGGNEGGSNVKPSPENGFSNGRLPDSVLCSLDFSPKDKVACYVEDELEAMNDAYAAKFGRNLQITNPGGGNAYRSYERQVEYYNNPNLRAAKPGYSNHGWGLAVDISGTGGYGGATYEWLNANAPSYGFDDGVSGEPWHWEWTGA